MRNLFSKKVLGSPVVLGGFGVTIVVVLGAGVYYWQGSRTPAPPLALTSTSASTAQGTGMVEPAQNGTLAFETGGRVALVPTVGQTVAAGQQIASLDIAALLAQLAQAQASLAQAQAKLDALNAGPRAVDLAPKETAVSTAEQQLTSDYSSAGQLLADAYSASYQTVHAQTDSLIQNPDSATPTLAFQTNSTQTSSDALSGRTSADSALAAWQAELSALSATSSPADIIEAGQEALNHLDVVRSFGDALTAALAAAIPTGTFPQSSITAANTAVGIMSATVQTQISSLEADEEQLSSDQLALQSAQDALSLAQASSTPQDIEAAQAAVEGAQASVQATDAQITDAVLVAPFAGTISSVQVKAGDVVSANTGAVVVTPDAALQVVAYFSEVDAAKLSAGQPADVTLDAYGENRHFSATIVSVDRSPTMQNNVPAYEVVVQFAQNDPAIAVGMTANVTVNTQ